LGGDRLVAHPHPTGDRVTTDKRDGQVRAIVANVNDRTAELFAAHEAELAPTLAALSAGDVTVAVRTWVALAHDALDGGEQPEPGSKVHLSTLYESRSPTASTRRRAATGPT
jgi:hypothetical protein